MPRREVVNGRIEKRLESCGLLASLDAADRRALADICELREFHAGQVLYLKGEPAAGFLLICSGRVKIGCADAAGREQVLIVVEKDQTCGEVAMLAGDDYPASAEALTDGEALYLPKAEFLSLIRRRPDIMLAFYVDLAGRLRHFVRLIEDLSLRGVPARLAKHLLDLRARARSESVVLETSKTVLASRLGTVPATISRSLGKLQERRLIKVDGRCIRIRDLDGLLAVAAGEKL